MIKLTHYNDSKERLDSHVISITEDAVWYGNGHNLSSHDLFDIRGFGETKDEAMEDFKDKFEYLLKEWVAFGKMLFETDVIENSIVEVDCFGKEIK